MGLRSLKDHFLAALPVIGPHADIEGELLLAGKKPLAWLPVFRDGLKFSNKRVENLHYSRKKLDKAVTKGLLISRDVKQYFEGYPEPAVIRHYCQPDKIDELNKVVAFNEKTFNRKNMDDVLLDQDMGHYLGYRRRDVVFFSLTNSSLMPNSLKNLVIKLNNPCQMAYQSKILKEAGTCRMSFESEKPSPEDSL